MEKKKSHGHSALVIANWKCYPQSIAEITRLAKASDRKGVVICPPFPYIPIVKKIIKKASLGAQDVFYDKGAYTGEISAEELKGLGVSYVIVGHSERRSGFNETDGIVAKKAAAAMKAGLKVILCAGEDAKTCRSGISAAKKKVLASLASSLEGVSAYISKDNLIVAYEPVWAIGSDNADTPENASSMASVIYEDLVSNLGYSSVRIVYGGSVNAENAKSYVSSPLISGLLVGRASVDSKKFPLLLDSLGIRK